MRMRLYLILLLFAASLGILVWIYLSATRYSDVRAQSPWDEIRDDLKACGRRKHVMSMQYDYFANVAAEEHRTDAERLFRAVALSEQMHERNCRQAVERLGDHYVAPAKAVIFRGVTDDNLTRCIAYKRQQLSEGRSEAIGRAMGRGNRYAARVLVWVSAGDMRQLMLMERCRDQISNQPIYTVCPKCGMLCEEGYLEAYCPLCMTKADDFVRFE